MTKPEDDARPRPKPEEGTRSVPAPTFREGPIDLPPTGTYALFSGLTRLSFVLAVLLPLVLSTLYITLVAKDRFAVEAKFVIRTAEDQGTSDLLGFISGGTAGSTQGDSYMVIDHLRSRQFLDRLAGHIDLRALFGSTRADPWLRLAPDATAEEILDFLPRVLDADFDPTSQIITIEAQAFTPADALALADATLAVTDEMITTLSDQARQDSLRHAVRELARAEEALRDQRLRLAAFREADQRIDPHSSVATQENLIGRLQQEQAQLLSEINGLRAFLAPDSPRIRVLQSRVASLTDRITEERRAMGSGGQTQGSTALNAAVTGYDALIIDLEFRERAYLSASAALEAARMEADRQQRYLTAFVRPSLPQSPTYPRSLLTIGMIGAVSFLLWGIASMFIHILREHLT